LIQIELNRKLYLAKPWFDEEKLIVKEERLKQLKGMFVETLKIFFNMKR
jgi:hypothetical protein